MSIKLGIAIAGCRLAIMTAAAASVGTLAGISAGSAIADGMLFAITLGGCIFALKAYGANPLRASFEGIGRRERREILKFLFNTNIAGTMRSLSTKLDVIVIAALSSTGVVALYKIASRIAGSLMLFSDPLLIAIYPELSKLHASGQTQNVRKLLWTLTKLMTGAAVVIVLAFGLFGKWLLGIIAQPQYAEAYPATMYIFAGTSLSMIFFWARPLMLVYGLADRLVLVAFSGLLVQFGLLYALTPSMRSDGGGIALAASYAVQILFILFLLSRRLSRGEGRGERGEV